MVIINNGKISSWQVPHRRLQGCTNSPMANHNSLLKGYLPNCFNLTDCPGENIQHGSDKQLFSSVHLSVSMWSSMLQPINLCRVLHGYISALLPDSFAVISPSNNCTLSSDNGVLALWLMTRWRECLRMSSIVSGIGWFAVSGMRRQSSPAVNARMPNNRKSNEVWICDWKEQQMQPGVANQLVTIISIQQTI